MWRLERKISPFSFRDTSINRTARWDGGQWIFSHEGRIISLLMSGGSAKPSSGGKRSGVIDQPIALPAFIGNTWAEWSIDRCCAVIVGWDKYLQALVDLLQLLSYSSNLSHWIRRPNVNPQQMWRFHFLCLAVNSVKTNKRQKTAEGQRWPHIFRSCYGLCGTELCWFIRRLGDLQHARKCNAAPPICGLGSFKSWPGAPLGAGKNPSFHNQSG